MEYQNKDLLCYARFDRGMQEQVRRLVTPNLIEEHRRRTVGPHSDVLARVLNYFRRAPMAGKYAVFAVKSFGPYRIVALSGVRGRRPEFIDDREFATLDDVYHAIFLKRIESLNRS